MGMCAKRSIKLEICAKILYTSMEMRHFEFAQIGLENQKSALKDVHTGIEIHSPRAPCLISTDNVMYLRIAGLK